MKPKGASKQVVWSSTNKKIATVSAKGKVKVKKSGTVTIVAKSKGNQRVVAKCKLKVYKATKTMNLLTNQSYSLAIGDTQRLSAIVTKPAKGAAPVEWSSSNEDVAKVNKEGIVTAWSKGEATIFAKSGKKKVKTKIKVVLPIEKGEQDEDSHKVVLIDGDKLGSGDTSGDDQPG